MTQPRRLLTVALGTIACSGPQVAKEDVAVVSVTIPADGSDEPDEAPPACSTLPETLATYRLLPSDVSDDPDEPLDELLPDCSGANGARVVARDVVSSDGLVGYVLALGTLHGNGFAGDCGSPSTCVHGLYVECSVGLVTEVIPADYRYALGFSETWTWYAGQQWRDVTETERFASGVQEEAELLKRGEPVLREIQWTRFAEGYRRWSPAHQ